MSIIYLSVSEISDFEECPYYYYKKHVFSRKKLGVKKEDGYVNLVSKAMFRKGSYNHKILDNFFDDTTQDITELAKKHIIKYGIEMDEYMDSKNTLERWVPRCGYLKNKVILKEEPIKQILPNGCAIIIKPDILLEVDKKTIMINDYKTGDVSYTVKDLEDRIQLKIYALVVSFAYPQYKRIICQYDAIKYKPVSIVVTPEYLADAEEWIDVRYGQVTSMKDESEFVPKCGTKCSSCEFYNGCPLMQDLDKIGANPVKRVSDKNIKKMVQKYLELDGISKIAEKQRIEYRDAVVSYIENIRGEYLSEKWGSVSYKAGRLYVKLK